MLRSMRATAVVQPLPQWAVEYMGWIAGASFAELLRDFAYFRVMMQAAQRRVCRSERLVPVDLPPWAERMVLWIGSVDYREMKVSRI